MAHKSGQGVTTQTNLSDGVHVYGREAQVASRRLPSGWHHQTKLGPTFWTLKALQWAAHMALAPMLCSGLGSTRGGGGLDWGHKAAHDARRTLHGSEVVACVFPLLLYSLTITTPKFPICPPPVRSRAGSDQPYRAWTYVLLSSLPPSETAAARRPGDRSPWFAASGTCFLAVLFSGPISQFLTRFPPGVNHSYVHQQRPPLSRASERATSNQLPGILMLHLRHRSQPATRSLAPIYWEVCYQKLCLA